MALQNLNRVNKYYLRFRRGLAANIPATATINDALEGEPAYTTDTKILFVHDGSNFSPAMPPLIAYENDTVFYENDAVYWVI